MSIDFEIAGENWKVAGKLMRTAQPFADALYGRGSGAHTYFQQLFKIIDPFFYYFWLYCGSDSGTSICWLQRCIKILFLQCNLTYSVFDKGAPV